MELKWLEDFVMLANTTSFSRAAQARNVTQSAFSRRIRQLEAWVGAPLISRATIPAELTDEGQVFLRFARETILSSRIARETLARPAPGKRNRLAIASLHTLTITRVPEWIAQIESVLPGLHTRIIPDRGGIEDNLDALVSGEADLFSTYAHPYVPTLPDPVQFDWILLGHEAILPVIDPKLVGIGQEGADFLAYAITTGQAVSYLDYGRASFIGTALDRLLAKRPLVRHVVHESSISLALREMALRGHGLCWLPESLIQDDLATGRLIPASLNPEWCLHAEIRLYRYKGDNRNLSDTVWRTIVNVLDKAS